MKPFSSRVVRSEQLTPEGYLRLSAAQRKDIQATEVTPPRLGAPGFGHIQVTYKTPRYRSS